MGGATFAYENDNVIQVPPMNPAFIQIDDPLFINNGAFTVDLLTFVGGTANTLYTTSSTRDYTNNGTMSFTPGVDFETFPASFGKATMANSWVNNGNGFGGGVVTAVNAFGGINIFQQGGVDGPGLPLNADVVGMGMIKVRATNVVNTGLITTDNTGLIDIVGKNVDLRHGGIVMAGPPTVTAIDGGGGGFGTNTVPAWLPSAQLTPAFATSPNFTNFTGGVESFGISQPNVYFESTSPPIVPVAGGNTRTWRIIFFRDFSPANVSAQVFFGNSGVARGEFNIQWTGTYRDLRTRLTATNYFLFSDVPALRRFIDASVPPTPGVSPAEFSYNAGFTPFFFGTPSSPSFVTNPFPVAVTNDFGFVDAIPSPLSLSTNQIVRGSATNLPGRIQVTSLDSLALDDTTSSGMSYTRLVAPNFLGNSNSYIATPYSDINLGVTNGSMVVSNLLTPFVPGWSGEIVAYSGSYLFSETNTLPNSTNLIVFTNDVRVLIVGSIMQPITTAFQKDVIIHAPNNLQINDALTIYNDFTSDTATLTVSTNDSSAYSTFGTLVIQPQDYNWAAHLPNLQYLTNWGIISTANQANFADNMPSLLSPRSQATPYQAFVNHGSITNQGIFVDANYFANSGSIVEDSTTVGFFGNGIITSAGFDIRAFTAISTNSLLQTTNGPISIAANSLLMSNSVVYSGRTLSFNTPCFLSDGYAFGNQFGHGTNATLPNVVTNGNFITTAGGVQMLAQPATGDLLGTTITNLALNNLLSINVWAGADRGASPAGFAENTAVGRMVFNSDQQPSHFLFQGLNNNNALYVDSLQFLGNTTNTDSKGNFTSFTIQPGMKIYYAQAIMNGVSIAEKLNGKNGGGFIWVSNYAGVYSSTNLNGTLYNQALVISPDIDSDHDNTVNRDDPTPIPAGTFDVANPGPAPCGNGSGNGNGSGTGGDNNPTNNTPHTPGTLAFPPQENSSGNPTFSLAAGSYNGLFYETNGVKALSSGFFSAKLTKQGSFSGKLQLGSSVYTISKSFTRAGNFTGLISGKNLAPLKVTLKLVNNDQIVGEVSNLSGTWTAQLLALSETKNASSFGLGKHSLVLSSDTVSGDSFGMMTLSKNGDIQWTGVLPDGGKASQKSALSKDGVWPLYSSLYGGNGSLIGWLQLSNSPSAIGGSAILVVPAGNQLYQNGVTNELKASGSGVTSSAGTSQKTLVLRGPHLLAPLTNSVTISGQTGQSGNNNLTLSLDVKNGLFNGSVLDPNSGQTLSFQGALLENSGNGGGFFLNASKDQGGKVSLVPAN